MFNISKTVQPAAMKEIPHSMHRMYSFYGKLKLMNTTVGDSCLAEIGKNVDLDDFSLQYALQVRVYHSDVTIRIKSHLLLMFIIIKSSSCNIQVYNNISTDC